MADKQPIPVLVFETLDSTNEEAKRRAANGELGPVWLVARSQTQGRGRRGRAWVSRSGNLYATGLYTLDKPLGEAANLSFAAALAVADVCTRFVDERIVRVKWPNDVLVNGRKISGILLESGERPDQRVWLAVGVGINLAHHPKDQERPATSLGEFSDEVTLEAAMTVLAERFEYWRRKWDEAGFSALRDAWLSRAFGLGEPCLVRLNDEEISGVFADLGPSGEMRLDLNDGQRRYISAGDVFFPRAV